MIYPAVKADLIEKDQVNDLVFFLVREMGLEPIRRGHTHLKRACLPIPALAHIYSLVRTLI